ncbi:MAG: hypothetical protein BWY31_02592 [Lentisphaerae bacterium ADurb.Bin242]|nr:MAG: hypothetical protein BWY31_02592 [Lentisphaerae bacterium ADurb.Bin242]
MGKTFLDRFLEYINSPERFNCVEFEYDGVEYQVSEGHFICYTDKSGKYHEYSFPKDIEITLDAKVLPGDKSLRELWGSIRCEEIPSYWY